MVLEQRDDRRWALRRVHCSIVLVLGNPPRVPRLCCAHGSTQAEVRRCSLQHLPDAPLGVETAEQEPQPRVAHPDGRW